MPVTIRCRHGVEVDRYRRCGGIFFDHRELATVLARRRSPRGQRED